MQNTAVYYIHYTTLHNAFMSDDCGFLIFRVR